VTGQRAVGEALAVGLADRVDHPARDPKTRNGRAGPQQHDRSRYGSVLGNGHRQTRGSMHIPAQQAVSGSPEDHRSGPDEDIAENVPVPAG
jgi:hypothetical protein